MTMDGADHLSSATTTDRTAHADHRDRQGPQSLFLGRGWGLRHTWRSVVPAFGGHTALRLGPLPAGNLVQKDIRISPVEVESHECV